MKKIVNIKYSNGLNSVTVDIPSICPHCGQSNSAEVFQGSSENTSFDDNLIIAFLARCTFDECRKYYALSYKSSSVTSTGWSLIKYNYSPPIHVDLPENIEKVSANFLEIYSQATIAETSKLDQIAGIGYRKSLEFLIKDYAIRYHPEEEAEIKGMLLFPCIKKYLSEFKRLQALATAATWIGNDETHYERRHSNQDVQSMKKFIKSAAQYIAAEYDADEAIDFIES